MSAVVLYAGLPPFVQLRHGRSPEGRRVSTILLKGELDDGTPTQASVTLPSRQLRALALMLWDEAHALDGGGEFPYPEPLISGDGA